MTEKKSGHNSNRFTPEEDALIKELVNNKQQHKTWKQIAEYLPGRTACQCRDRYNQYLFKKLSTEPWSPDEDKIIIEKFQLYGPKWVKISEFLPGRSGNNVKNRWNGALRKYHGIEHNITKQVRRSRYDKWIGSHQVKKGVLKIADIKTVEIIHNDNTSTNFEIPTLTINDGKD